MPSRWSCCWAVLPGAVTLAVRLAPRRSGRSAAGLAVHAWWFAPQVTGENPPPADGEEPLVVMAANIGEGAGDPIDLVRRVSEEGVGLLVVQEITVADLADMERAGVAEVLPYRVGEPGSDGHGTMVFSAVELTDPRPLPTLHDGWIVTMGDLTVIGVHPSAPTTPDEWRDDHAVLARAVAEVEPDLVVGDLNATIDHPPMRALADAGYRDAAELANEGWQPTWPDNGAVDLLGLPLPALTPIDHVLVGPRLAAVGTRTLSIPDSDHRAVVAEVARK